MDNEQMQQVIDKVDDYRAECKLQGRKITIVEAAKEVGVGIAAYYNYKRKLGVEGEEMNEDEKNQIEIFNLTENEKSEIAPTKKRTRRKTTETNIISAPKNNDMTKALMDLVAAQNRVIELTMQKGEK